MLGKAFNAEQVLDLAESLSTHGGEAQGRCAISRAYYGAFLLARDIAHINDKTSQAHAKTWRHYVDKGEKDLARDLWGLRDARNKADYNTDVNLSGEDCRKALQACRRVHAALKRIAGRERYRTLSLTSSHLTPSPAPPSSDAVPPAPNPA